MEDECAVARNERKDRVAGLLGGDSGGFRGSEEATTKRVIEVDAACRTKRILKRPRKAAGAIEFVRQLGIKPPIDVMKLASGLLGGLDEDVETAVAARLDDEAADEGSKVSFAVGVGAPLRMHLDWIELLTQAGTPAPPPNGHGAQLQAGTAPKPLTGVPL